jgi:hypothetical protein
MAFLNATAMLPAGRDVGDICRLAIAILWIRSWADA